MQSLQLCSPSVVLCHAPPAKFFKERADPNGATSSVEYIPNDMGLEDSEAEDKDKRKNVDDRAVHATMMKGGRVAGQILQNLN